MLLAVVTAALALAAPAPPSVVARGLGPLTGVTAPASEPGRLYVVQQEGVVRVVDRGRVQARPFLDIRSLISSGGERGLLSIAFHPQYAKNHLFYVYYTDRNGDTRVVQYRSSGGRAVPSSAKQLLFEKQPFPNHNGGQLAFGPDGFLYIGLGDGGSGGDPNNNGQTMTNKLAKIWTLDVSKAGAQPVMVAYGLRNPWRFAFDRANGDLYIADVGQGEWEEIDYVPRAQLGKLANFGWAVYEGKATFDSSRSLDRQGRLVFPIQVYSHNVGCSVTGGFVYRGKARPDLKGRYFYGDYCSGTVWSLQVRNGKATGVRKESYKIPGLTSFGEDARGGLYAVNEAGTLYRIAG
ncbi:MAG TPA: PQQ-dependent sugar dehydrogenase [Gaiellaceae bacterium]|nr:PQQ-dependent sugar dehydrogenase [Gaiellaceae bacterium]